MALKDSFINLNKALRTTLQNVPAVVDTLESGFSEIGENISTGADVKKAVNSFNTINGGLLSECIVKLVPVQSGSGDPSPDNVRPISGHTQVDVDVSDGQTTQEQVTVNLGGTYYFGTLDVVSGKLTGDGKKAVYAFDGTEGFLKSSVYPGSFFLSWNNINPAGKVGKAFKCSHAKLVTIASGEYAYGKCISDGSINLWLGQPEWTITDFKNYLATQYANGTPVTIEYEVDTPVETETQISPTMVKALVGDNQFSAPLGGQEITEVEYKEIFTFSDVEKAINNAIASVYPEAPAADGSYVLTLVKDGTSITRSWVSTES